MYFESECEWIFYHLWTKKSPRAPVFSFQIADTVVLRQGVPQIWYFNSKEGYILRKYQSKVTPGKIFQRFSQSETKCEDVPSLVAYHYADVTLSRSSQGRCDLLLNYVQPGDLRPYLHFNVQDEREPQPNLVQKFVTPKQSHNHILRVQWSLNNCQIEKLTNRHSMYDAKHSVESRMVTYEGLDIYTKREKVSGGPEYDALIKCMWQIHNHVKRNSETQIIGGQFFFKIDYADRVTFLFATCIKTDRPVRVLNGNKSLGLGLLTIQSHINQLQIAEEPQQHSEYHSYSVKNYQLNKEASQDQFATQYANPNHKASSNDLNLRDESNYSGDDSLRPEIVTNVSINRNIGKPLHRESQLTSNPSVTIQLKQHENIRNSASVSDLRASHTTPISNISGGSCPFCQDKIDGEAGTSGFELTVNQIIKLYDHYEGNPNNLLLLQAESERQQQFYEDMYGQLTYASRQQQESQFTQQSMNSQRVPRPISRVFGVQSFQKYLVLKNDPAFIYRPIKICDSCYDNIKNLVGQSEMQAKVNNFGLESGSPSSSHKQNLVEEDNESELQEQSGRYGDQKTPSDTDYDEDDQNSQQLDEAAIESSPNSSPSKKSRKAPATTGFTMFSKVEAGKEVLPGKSSARDQISNKTKTDFGLSAQQSHEEQDEDDCRNPINVKLSVKVFDTQSTFHNPNLAEKNLSVVLETGADKLDVEKDMQDASRRLKLRGQRKLASATVPAKSPTLRVNNSSSLNGSSVEKSVKFAKSKNRGEKSEKDAKTVINFVKAYHLPVIDTVSNRNKLAVMNNTTSSGQMSAQNSTVIQNNNFMRVQSNSNSNTAEQTKWASQNVRKSTAQTRKAQAQGAFSISQGKQSRGGLRSSSKRYSAANDPSLQTDYRILPESSMQHLGPNYINDRPQFLPLGHVSSSDNTSQSTIRKRNISHTQTQQYQQHLGNPQISHMMQRHQASTSSLPVHPPLLEEVLYAQQLSSNGAGTTPGVSQVQWNDNVNPGANRDTNQQPKSNRQRPFSAKQQLSATRGERQMPSSMLAQLGHLPPQIVQITPQSAVHRNTRPEVAGVKNPFVYSKFDVARVYLNAGNGVAAARLPPRPSGKKPKRESALSSKFKTTNVNSLEDNQHKHTQEQLHYYLLMEEAARANGLTVEQCAQMQGSNGFSMGTMTSYSQSTHNVFRDAANQPANITLKTNETFSQAITEKNVNPAGGLGLLDLNAMGNDEMAIIAANADNLIGIIKNIKAQADSKSMPSETAQAGAFPAIDESSIEETRLRSPRDDSKKSENEIEVGEKGRHVQTVGSPNHEIVSNPKEDMFMMDASSTGKTNVRVQAQSEADLKQTEGDLTQKGPMSIRESAREDEQDYSQDYEKDQDQNQDEEKKEKDTPELVPEKTNAPETVPEKTEKTEKSEEDELDKQMRQMQNQQLPKTTEINENWW